VLASSLLFIETMAHLILASSSPRRKELLLQVGLNFTIHSPDIDESVCEFEQVEQYVLRLAKTKAQEVLKLYPEATIIAADTTLTIDDQIIGKPESKQHAFEIWRLLSGRKHEVLTGICVAKAQQLLSAVVRTEVEFQPLSLNDMEEYWETGEPIGKAGAYAIQGIAAKYVTRINGSYSNVVGLPLHETVQLLDRIDQCS
jgi:septum formation protein